MKAAHSKEKETMSSPFRTRALFTIFTILWCYSCFSLAGPFLEQGVLRGGLAILACYIAITPAVFGWYVLRDFTLNLSKDDSNFSL